MCAGDQPWLDDDNEFVDLPLDRRQPMPRVRTGGGRIAMLKSERAMILARYDDGAMPHAVYAVVRNLEIEISELQMKSA